MAQHKHNFLWVRSLIEGEVCNDFTRLDYKGNCQRILIIQKLVRLGVLKTRKVAFGAIEYKFTEDSMVLEKAWAYAQNLFPVRGTPYESHLRLSEDEWHNLIKATRLGIS